MKLYKILQTVEKLKSNKVVKVVGIILLVTIYLLTHRFKHHFI
jgi:hypothetical protein